MLEPHIAPPACVTVTQLDKGNSFRALHQGTRAFVIANVWVIRLHHSVSAALISLTRAYPYFNPYPSAG
jgi:hypothetical protein